MVRHVISAAQFADTNFLVAFLKHVEKLKRDYLESSVKQSLEGYGVILLFNEPSTRTRLSFSMAAQYLGAAVENIIGETQASFSKGESYEDAIKVLARYCDAIVMRSTSPEIMKAAVAVSHVPVINAGDGGNEHPTQALLDLFTMYERFKALDNLRVVFVGDLKYGRTVHSNLLLLNHFSGTTFVLAAPQDLQLPQSYVDAVQRKGNRIVKAESLKDAAKDADVVYMTRVQKERLAHPEEYTEARMGRYRMTKEVMALLPQRSIVMHPLPRDSSHGNPEIAPDVDDDERSKYFEQVRNGVPTRMALLEFVFGKFMPEYEWKNP